MTPAMTPAELELVRRLAEDLHGEWCTVDFATCPHPDCTAARELLARHGAPVEEGMSDP
jgi:hypothetical protein